MVTAWASDSNREAYRSQAQELALATEVGCFAEAGALDIEGSEGSTEVAHTQES